MVFNKSMIKKRDKKLNRDIEEYAKMQLIIKRAFSKVDRLIKKNSKSSKIRIAY